MWTCICTVNINVNTFSSIYVLPIVQSTHAYELEFAVIRYFVSFAAEISKCSGKILGKSFIVFIYINLSATAWGDEVINGIIISTDAGLAQNYCPHFTRDIS